LEVASAEYEAYFWNDLFLDQIPKVLEKIKGNMEKPPPKPAVLDGLTEGEKKWARLWEHCHPDMVNVAQKLVQDHLKNKKAALADLGSITPGGKPPPESEYDQLENKLGADKGKLEKLLDNGYHFTWFAETDPVRDIEDVSEIFMIGFSSTSRYSSDGVDMGMGSPQTIKYIHSDNYSPFVIICGTTEINGKGDPKMLVRPVNPQAYNVESGIWEISSLNQFLSEVQIDMILPEALIRPTSVIVEDTGRVLIWDSEGIGLYALNEIDEAGLPHAIQSDSLLQLSQQDQEALRGRPILCQYGEQLAAFTRPITKDRGSSPVTFLFRNQDAGLYDHISTYEPTDLPWIRPLIPQPVFSGESWISVSGSGGHEVEVKILSGQETVHSILQTILDSGREPTLLSMPDSLIGGQFVQVVDLVNQSESVKEPVVERLVHALTIPGRKKLVEDASWHHVISVIDIREFKIYIRDGYRDRVKSALDASDDWVIEDLAWDTPFDVSDIDQFDKAQSEQPWHILVIKDHYTLSVPGNTRIKIEHSDSSIDYCRLLEEYEVCLPFTGIDSVAKFGDIKCLEYPEASWKGSPEVSVQHIPVSIRDLGLLEKDYSALVPGERPIKKRKLVIFGILMGIILAILILLSLELSGFFCSGPCAITNCTPAHPCTWKGKTYTSGKICGFGEGVICDPGILYDCRCNTFIETLPNGTKQPTCLCH